MHPSFGVPWPRLQRAAARLSELHAPSAHGHVHALLFLCGLKYLLTYREANGRRLSHYLDDGLREAADNALPALMKCSREFPIPHSPPTRLPRDKTNVEFEQLIFAFAHWERFLPTAILKWAQQGNREANLLRLSFGTGVIARFAPDSHTFVREMLEKPLILNTPVFDVLESFRWDPEWSLVLAR